MSAIEIILFSILFLLQLGSLILFSLAFIRLDAEQRISRQETRAINRFLATIELEQGLTKLEYLFKRFDRALERKQNDEKEEVKAEQ